jgi:hypothetical protein
LSLALEPYVDDCICIECAAREPVPPGHVEMHDATRQELREYGLTEGEVARIEAAVKERISRRTA